MNVFVIGWAFTRLLSMFSSVSAQEIYGPPDAPLVAEVLDTKIHSTDPDEMKYVILDKLFDRFATVHDVEVTPAEIDAYVFNLQRAAERDRKDYEERRQAIARKLESTSLTILEIR